MSPRRPSHVDALRRLADRVLEAPDLPSLTDLLTRVLPEALELRQVALLLWDRKLESFEALLPGDKRGRRVAPGDAGLPDMETRFLLSGDTLLETPAGKGEGVLVPLMARSGLVGMMALGGPSRAAFRRWSKGELRALSVLASRSALAIENQLYQRELIASERITALGTMAGMLAHDFRGPMTVIRGYAETLLEGTASAREVQERAGLIVQMVDRLERMTRETLDFARGAGPLVRRSVHAPTFLEELAAGIELELPGLSVERDLQVPDGVFLLADVDKLRRAVENVAANARDAMGGAGRLRFSARVEGGADAGRLVMLLADEGPGVPEEIRETVFAPFVTRGKKGGTGLGLAVARRFVEDHGGSAELLAEPGGACFRLAVPLQGPASGGIESRDVRATSLPPPASHGKR